MDITNALAPKSDQLDFADIDASGPRTFTVVDVHENGAELADQQPVNISLAEFPRVWRPSKGMLRVMAHCWGKDVKLWAGRKVELYGDPNVYVGREKRGGTRISRISDITKDQTVLVNPRGGKGAYFTVKPLPAAPTEPAPLTDAQIASATDVGQLGQWWKQHPAQREAIEARVGELKATEGER